MQLVHEEKGRKGQRNLYQLGETVAKFEIGLLMSLAEWKKLEGELEKMRELVKSHTVKPEKAGTKVAYLIYKAAFMTASFAFDPTETFSINAEKGLLHFSAMKFNDFLDEVTMFGRQYPEIAGEFEETSDKILKIIGPSLENTEGNSADQTA